MEDGRAAAAVISLAALVGLCLVAGLRMEVPKAAPAAEPPPVAKTEGFASVQPLPDPPRLRALVVGDSNIFGPLGKFLQRGLGALGYDVVRRGKPTSGLARPDFFDWTAEVAVLLDRHEPDLVIAMFGGNDGQRMESTHLSGKPAQMQDIDAWAQEYQHRVRTFAEQLRGEGRTVFILSPTNRRPRFAREKMQRVRAAQREALDGMRGVTWIDMFPLSSDAHGEWLKEGADVNGNLVNYRRGDGIHLTPAGGQVVGQRVLERLLDSGVTLCGTTD